MAINVQGNLDSREAQEVRQRSEFIKRVNDFAHFMQKEYIDECDGDIGLLICALDKTIGDGKAGAAHIVLGGKATVTAGLVSMMQQENMRDVFHVARTVAGECAIDRENIGGLRRRLRLGYWMAGLCALWTAFLVFLQVWGVANWITTVSNLLLMGFIGYQLWMTIRDQRRKLKRIEREEMQERRERLDHAMGMFTAMLKDMAGRMNGDDDDV